MVKENLLPNPDLLHSLLFFKAFLSLPVRYLQNSSVSELPAYQLRSLRATPYEHKRITFGERRGGAGVYVKKPYLMEKVGMRSLNLGAILQGALLLLGKRRYEGLDRDGKISHEADRLHDKAG
jgi:hypothetical protein